MDDKIKFVEREMSKSELKLMNKWFDLQTKKSGNPLLESKRITITIEDNKKFIGCATGLTRDSKKYFYLTDLIIDTEYRNQKLGSKVLKILEKKIKKQGFKYIFTHTAKFQAPKFYVQQGYKKFNEMKDWYMSGESRIVFIKKL